MKIRIAVVDDNASQRDGRVSWLTSRDDLDPEGMTFEQAAALGPRWRDFNIVVLDAHDRRSLPRRRQAAADIGIEPIAPHDRIVGARIAEMIREHCDREQTRIIMISAVARSEIRALRMRQAGVDYAFEHYEADESAETFIRAVCQPETFSPAQPPPPDWRELGFTDTPDVRSAIAAAERSEAGIVLLDATSARALTPTKLADKWRKLRATLQEYFPSNLAYDGGKVRQSRSPRKDWLIERLDDALGKDLPVDVVDRLDGVAVRTWMKVTADALHRHRREIDGLNVFPVPDKDTGTNLYQTMQAAAESVERLPAGASPHDTWQAAAQGARLSAHGNSGAIMSLVLQGLARAMGEGAADGLLLKKGLHVACDLAPTAVCHPTEGTILTVLAAASAAAQGPSLAGVAKSAARGARTALHETPAQLPVLAEHRVVDAGGVGLCILLDALVAVITQDFPTRYSVPPRL